MRPLEAWGAWLNDVSQPETNSPSSATFFIPWQGFSVKVPREEATKAQSRAAGGRGAEAGTGPPGPCATGRGRGGVSWAERGHSQATPFPLRIEVQQCSFSRSGPSSVDMGSPGVCSLVWERGRGEYRVVHSQDISLLSTLSWALGVRRGRPGCYRACRRSLWFGGELGWARALHCLPRRLQGRRWPRRACSGEEESMRSGSPGHPVGPVPKFCLACQLLRLLPVGPRAPALW